MSADRPVATKLPAGPLPCTLAPAGWVCTREADHESPCAAVPVRPLTLEEIPGGTERPAGADRLKHLAAAIRALLAVAITFQLLHWTDAQIGTVMMAVETVGALIYASRR